MEDTNITITLDHSELAFKFLRTLFEGNVSEFWETVSKVDQARIYGMYRVYVTQDDAIQMSFSEYVSDHIIPDIREIYEGVINDPGIASVLRETEEGEDRVFMLPNIVEGRKYEEETSEWVFPISMTWDTNLYKGELSTELKVRLYSDQDYKGV